MEKTKSKARKPAKGSPGLHNAGESESEDNRSDFGLLPRGLAVIEAVIKEERPLTAVEIGESVGLNSSTTHRLLQTLTNIGYLSRDASKRYYPTARALFPISLYHPLNALRRSASEELRNLRQTFAMTTALQIFLGARRVVLEVMLANESFSPYYQTEVTAPIYATASGKLLLLTLPEAERSQLLGPEPYQSHASHTMLTRAEVEKDLAQVAARGYSLTRDEMLQGLSGIAAPIRIPSSRVIGAVVVSGSTRNFTADAIAEMATAVKRSAELFSLASPDIRAVSRFLGY